MTELTKKSDKFIWNPKCENSFQELKRRLTRAPVLALSNGKDSLWSTQMLLKKVWDVF